SVPPGIRYRLTVGWDHNATRIGAVGRQSKLNPPTGGVGIAEIVGAATPVCTPLTPVPVRPSSSTATACARQTVTPLAAGTPASSAPPTVAEASASQSGGTPARGWTAITAAIAVLAADAALFFRRRYARS
ncbi:MAG: hypothetical protein ACLP5E_13300, partial [Streptosporangiaceae bacterium]